MLNCLNATNKNRIQGQKVVAVGGIVWLTFVYLSIAVIMIKIFVRGSGVP